MAKHPKTNRTQLKDLAVNEQELTGQEMEKVQGGSTVKTPPPPPPPPPDPKPRHQMRQETDNK